MVSSAMVVKDMLNTLEEEDCKMAISYIQSVHIGPRQRCFVFFVHELLSGIM